ncbi:hypothetical protein [Chelativorans salis]|uniref:DUF1127 domain-containing protein n=1 Tax=Chelativorans salis TaxID=2978478 RepID=A0ABT2LK97_9HYPH|nr:hypothetical protein [Chelativorans sp. EGI FJ00035]MCT7374784.1 hypothetical protein [Chelativorans sp. EGI FJ00035]
MVQLFLSIAAHFRRRMEQFRAIKDYADDQSGWRRDPLSHPDLATMNERELADLPFEPTRVCRC